MDDGQRTTECEDRARILETEFAKISEKISRKIGGKISISDPHTITFSKIWHMFCMCNFDRSCICVFGHLGICIWVTSEWYVDEWIVDVISFQKIFGLCGLKCHIVEIWIPYYGRMSRLWTDDVRRTTECEDSARILKQNSQFDNNIWLGGHKYMMEHRQSKLCETQKAIWWAGGYEYGDG